MPHDSLKITGFQTARWYQWKGGGNSQSCSLSLALRTQFDGASPLRSGTDHGARAAPWSAVASEAATAFAVLGLPLRQREPGHWPVQTRPSPRPPQHRTAQRSPRWQSIWSLQVSISKDLITSYLVLVYTSTFSQLSRSCITWIPVWGIIPQIWKPTPSVLRSILWYTYYIPDSLYLLFVLVRCSNLLSSVWHILWWLFIV